MTLAHLVERSRARKLARFLAAQKLEELGWSVVHYAQATKRAIQSGERFHEDRASAHRARGVERLRRFFNARDAFRRWR